MRSGILGVTLLALALISPAAAQPAEIPACMQRNDQMQAARVICPDRELRRVDAHFFEAITLLQSEVPSFKHEELRATMTAWLLERDKITTPEEMKNFYKATIPIWFEYLDKLIKERSA